MRWYARSSWRSSDLRCATHWSGRSPIRNAPSLAPLGGLGLGGRQSLDAGSSSGRYAVLRRDPAPVARSNSPRRIFSFLDKPPPRSALDDDGLLSSEDVCFDDRDAREEDSRSEAAALDLDDDAPFIHLGFFHSRSSAAHLSLSR